VQGVSLEALLGQAAVMHAIGCSFRLPPCRELHVCTLRRRIASITTPTSWPSARHVAGAGAIRDASTSSHGIRTPALLRAYGAMQQRSPYITQLCTSATIFYLGDLSAQSLSNTPYEPIRGLRALTIGAGLAIPGYTWFMWLARSFNHRSAPLSLGIKVLLQQLIFMPLVQTYFFSMHTLLSGGTVADAKRRVTEALPVTWMNSWKVWPMAMAFTFTYVPMQYRSAVNALVGTCWQTYLSWVNQRVETTKRKMDNPLPKTDVSGLGQVKELV
jgi:protein Mpv17